MNGLLEKTNTGATDGKPVAPVPPAPPKPVTLRIAPDAVGSSPPVTFPHVPIGTPGYKFRFALGTTEGTEERREHERLRKSKIRAAQPASEPAPLSPANETGPAQTGLPGQAPGVDLSPVEVVLAWKPEDVAEFTDELVELSEAKRIGEFVTDAREAKLPPKLVAEIERDAEYGPKTKAGLKRAIAAVAAKWLNKSGVSSRNKEEIALMFLMVTVRMQGIRARRDMRATIEEYQREQAKTNPPKPAPIGASIT